MKADVAVALSLLRMAGTTITADAVKEMLAAAPTSIVVPQLMPSVVILAAYDALLPEVAA